MNLDEPFFREWRSRQDGDHRSIPRTQGMMDFLGVDTAALPPTLCVVGSKGKGTAVAAATLVLAAQGARVGTIMSPSFRTNRERIRLNGAAIGADLYTTASSEVARFIESVPRDASGYLSPAGAFLSAGLRVLLDSNVDYLVVEEGLGGRSDDVGLLSPDVLGVTPIFFEHGDILGSTVGEIALDLVGAASNTTSAIVTTPHQSPDVMASINSVAQSTGARIVEASPSEPVWNALSSLPGLSRANAYLGYRAAKELYLGSLDEGAATDSLVKLWLPGRLSVHKDPSRDALWVVDAAINAVGTRVALDWCREHVGEPDVILLSVPTSKDREGCIDVLDGLPLRELAGAAHMSFTSSSGSRPPDLSTFLRENGDLSGTVLALGTITFVADVLEYLDVPTESWWRD